MRVVLPYAVATGWFMRAVVALLACARLHDHVAAARAAAQPGAHVPYELVVLAVVVTGLGAVLDAVAAARAQRAARVALAVAADVQRRAVVALLADVELCRCRILELGNSAAHLLGRVAVVGAHRRTSRLVRDDLVAAARPELAVAARR